jgi:hypothetical protein
MPHIAAMHPIIIGRFASGAVSLVNEGCHNREMESIPEWASITSAPENIPPTPIPAIALPTINTVLEGARPHNKEPSSKTAIANKKVPLIYTTREK